MKFDFIKRPEFIRLANEQKCNELPMMLELLIFLLVILISSTVAGLLAAIPMTLWLLSPEHMQVLLAAAEAGPMQMLDQMLSLMGGLPAWMRALTVAANGLLGVAAILYCKRFEKRSLASMGLRRQRALPHYLLGALLGAVSFSAVAGLCCAFGGIRIDGVQASAELWPTLGMMLVAFMLQSAGEELLTRGYLMASLSKRSSLAVSVGVSAVAFSLMHTGNFGVQPLALLNIVLVGVVLGLYVLRTGDLWGACGYHALWNFFQGNLFGLPVSGITPSDSLLLVRVTGHSDLLTGGAFGLEGSLCCTLVLLASLGLLVWQLGKLPPAEPPEEEAAAL